LDPFVLNHRRLGFQPDRTDWKSILRSCRFQRAQNDLEGCTQLPAGLDASRLNIFEDRLPRWTADGRQTAGAELDPQIDDAIQTAHEVPVLISATLT
jgi:hypothetical protein